MLAQLPWEEQALILVVAGQAVGQLSLRAQGQGLPARQLCLCNWGGWSVLVMGHRLAPAGG